LICISGLLLQDCRPKQIKEFSSERDSWRHTLKLYDNSGYTYTERLKNNVSEIDLKDTGNYKLADNKITLKTLNTKAMINKKPRELRMFNNRTFMLGHDTLFITGRVQMRDSIDSVLFHINNLFEVPVKE